MSKALAERVAALEQEGNGGRVLTGFVEVVFDNSDNRLPVPCSIQSRF